MADREQPLPQSNAASQPFDGNTVPPDTGSLVHPRLLAAASHLRGGLYGYQSRWSLGRQHRALAERYGLQPAEDDRVEDAPLRDDWES